MTDSEAQKQGIIGSGPSRKRYLFANRRHVFHGIPKESFDDQLVKDIVDALEELQCRKIQKDRQYRVGRQHDHKIDGQTEDPVNGSQPKTNPQFGPGGRFANLQTGRTVHNVGHTKENVHQIFLHGNGYRNQKEFRGSRRDIIDHEIGVFDVTRQNQKDDEFESHDVAGKYKWHATDRCHKDKCVDVFCQLVSIVFFLVSHDAVDAAVVAFAGAGAVALFCHSHSQTLDMVTTTLLI